MGALFDFKYTCDSTLVYVCQADAEKCIFVWTILSQTPRRTPQVTSDAGRISARIFLLFPKERRMLRKRDYQGRLSFHFFDRWMTDLATHRQNKVQAMSWKKLQMLELCLFTWSWMGPINCAPNPILTLTRHGEAQVTMLLLSWFRVISAHNKIGPCQFGPMTRPKQKNCVVRVTRPYLRFWSRP